MRSEFEAIIVDDAALSRGEGLERLTELRARDITAATVIPKRGCNCVSSICSSSDFSSGSSATGGRAAAPRHDSHDDRSLHEQIEARSGIYAALRNARECAARRNRKQAAEDNEAARCAKIGRTLLRNWPRPSRRCGRRIIRYATGLERRRAEGCRRGLWGPETSHGAQSSRPCRKRRRFTAIATSGTLDANLGLRWGRRRAAVSDVECCCDVGKRGVLQ